MEDRPKYELAVYDQKVKDSFLKVADEQTYLKEVIFAYQAVKNSEYLQKCDTESIRSAIVNVALTGVSLNPVLQRAYLVPRKGKCCLDLSYKGLSWIAVDSGCVWDIDAVAVFEGDEFYYEMGLNPILIHKPLMYEDKESKPKVKAVYAIATLHHGIKKFVVLDKEKIERARKSSMTGNIWNEHYDEMAKKTAIKLLYKNLPQQSERMSNAVSVLNEHEGIEPGKKAKEVMERFEEKGE